MLNKNIFTFEDLIIEKLCLLLIHRVPNCPRDNHSKNQIIYHMKTFVKKLRKCFKKIFIELQGHLNHTLL